VCSRDERCGYDGCDDVEPIRGCRNLVASQHYGPAIYLSDQVMRLGTV